MVRVLRRQGAFSRYGGGAVGLWQEAILSSTTLTDGTDLCAAQICSAPVIRKALTPPLSQRERGQEESPLPHFGGEG